MSVPSISPREFHGGKSQDLVLDKRRKERKETNEREKTSNTVGRNHRMTVIKNIFLINMRCTISIFCVHNTRARNCIL